MIPVVAMAAVLMGRYFADIEKTKKKLEQGLINKDEFKKISDEIHQNFKKQTDILLPPR